LNGDAAEMNQNFYVHGLDGKAPGEWHLLDDHLKGTAELAKSFAGAFGSGEWGYLNCGAEGNDV